MSFLQSNRSASKENVYPRLALMLACALLSCPGRSLANEMTTVVEIVKTHCSECHNAETKEGGLDLTSSGTNLSDAQQRTLWTHVFDRVHKNEMPPAPQQLPDLQRVQLLQILEPLLHDADLSDVLANGRGPMRRLNRDEFEQNLRDLLLLPDLNIRDMLPEDRVGHHFNKTTALLDLSRVQLIAFLDATESALSQAMASGMTPPPASKHRFLATQMFQEAETFGNREAMFYAKNNQLLPLNGGELAELRRSGQHDPDVELAIFRSAHWPYYGYPHGFVAALPGRYKVRFSARSVLQQPGFQLVPATKSVPMTFRARKPSGPDVSGDVRATGGIMDIVPEISTYETTIQLKPTETFEYSLLGLPVPLARNVNNGPPEYRYPPFPEGGQPGVAFQWLEIEGPLSSPEWPPASHRILFDELPMTVSAPGSRRPISVMTQTPEADARRLLRRFVDRAVRQPLEDSDFEPFEQLILSRLQAGDDFTEAILAGYQAFLCSSHYLFLNEPISGDHSGHHFAIAFRLSHLLTNSAPDQTLLDKASKKQLLNKSELKMEVDRLMAVPDFDRFITNFTDYWLNLRHIYRDEPDSRLYPEYRFDNYLAESMERETREFISLLMKENLPAATLVASDFVLANDRLADHYKLEPMNGSQLRKIKLAPDSPYGGLLTQGAILKVTANGTNTSPVVRGAWLMDRILGDPPPAPPASVPAVEPDIRSAKTIRDLLKKHTESASCAACHARFDPVGLALENFDVMGAWRDRYRALELGEAITGIDRAGHDFSYSLASTVDASGQLLDGKQFHDVRELKRVFAENPRQLARNLIQQWTVYATGTPVRFSDRREVEKILDQCSAQQYPIKDLFVTFIQSRIFCGTETQ
jgi:hypothetical protein